MKARLKAKKSDLSNVDQLMLIWKISRGCFSYWLLTGAPWAWTQCLIHFELCLICSSIIWCGKNSSKQVKLNQKALYVSNMYSNSNLLTSPKNVTIFPTLIITLFYDQHSNQISLNFLLPECSTLVPTQTIRLLRLSVLRLVWIRRFQFLAKYIKILNSTPIQSKVKFLNKCKTEHVYMKCVQVWWYLASLSMDWGYFRSFTLSVRGSVVAQLYQK